MSLADYWAAAEAQFAGVIAPNQLPDVLWTQDYLNAGATAGPPLLLALAENWEGPSVELKAELSATSPWLDGYQFSMWGEPSFLEAAAIWLRADQRLDYWTGGEPLGVAAVRTGTRGAMSDIARLLAFRRRGRIVYAAPAYDYAAVFGIGGFADGAVEADPATGFVLDGEALLSAIASPDAAVLMINAQHNPTARQWSADAIRRVLWAALEQGLAVLFDDAHYALVQSGERVSALAIWLEILAQSGRTTDWFAVRSLGKQLNCNGWGIGMISAPLRLLEPLVLQFRPLREYGINARAQQAVGRHLASGGAHADAARLNDRIRRNRAALFVAIGSQRAALAVSSEQVCTPFCWFHLPPGLGRQELMRRTGVLVGDLRPSPLVPLTDEGLVARVYAGAHPDVFDLALERMIPVIH